MTAHLAPFEAAPKEIMLKVQSLDDFLRGVAARDPQQPEFMQAVQEVMLSLAFIEKHPHYAEHAILESGGARARDPVPRVLDR